MPKGLEGNRPYAESDPREAIKGAIARVVPMPRLASAIARELVILYYGLFSWRANPHVPPRARVFPIYQKIGHADLLAVLPIACVLEIVPVHLLVRRWNAIFAWAITVVSIYALVWLIGLARSFRLRPTLVAPDYIYIRYGMIFELWAPRQTIAWIGPAEPADARFAVPRKSEPTVCIEFTQPLIAEALFGLRKRVMRLALTPDDQHAFERALAELVSAS